MSKFTKEDFERLADDLTERWAVGQPFVSVQMDQLVSEVALSEQEWRVIADALRIAARAMDREKIANEVYRLATSKNDYEKLNPIGKYEYQKQADALIAMFTDRETK